MEWRENTSQQNRTMRKQHQGSVRGFADVAEVVDQGHWAIRAQTVSKVILFFFWRDELSVDAPGGVVRRSVEPSLLLESHVRAGRRTTRLIQPEPASPNQVVSVFDVFLGDTSQHVVVGVRLLHPFGHYGQALELDVPESVAPDQALGGARSLRGKDGQSVDVFVGHDCPGQAQEGGHEPRKRVPFEVPVSG